MAKKQAVEEPVVAAQTEIEKLTEALARAIQSTKPVEKKNAANRKPADPWQPKDGTKKPKLKRAHYLHGYPIDPDFHYPAELALLNQLKTGRYLNGFVKVFKRKDSGIDIDYPVKTASQRMRLASMGITEVQDEYGNVIKTGLQSLLERCITEAKNPKREQPDEDND